MRRLASSEFIMLEGMQLHIKAHQRAIEPTMLGCALQRKTGVLKSLSENTLPAGLDSKISTQIIDVASPLPLYFHYRPRKKKSLSSLVLRKRFETQFLCDSWPALLRGGGKLQGEYLLPAKEHCPFTARGAPGCFLCCLPTWCVQQLPEQCCALDGPSPSWAPITCFLCCCGGGCWSLPTFERFPAESKLTSL